MLNPQVDSLLFAAVLLLLQPIQKEEVDPVFQIGGLSTFCMLSLSVIHLRICSVFVMVTQVSGHNGEEVSQYMGPQNIDVTHSDQMT